MEKKSFSVTVLGSGTSSGIPCLGVKYSDAFLSNPKNHRTRCSIVIHGPEGNLLIDSSPDMRTQLLREKIDEIDRVIITHAHADHMFGMHDLRGLSLKHGGEMEIYTLPVHQQSIRNVFPFAFLEPQPGIWLPRFKLHDIAPELSLCGLRIETMIMKHGKMDVIAIRVGDFAYLTDVKTIPENELKKLYHLDTLIVGAVRYKPHPNHFNIEEALALIKEISPKRVYFTHISDEIDHNTAEKDLPEHVKLAYDGLKLSFSIK